MNELWIRLSLRIFSNSLWQEPLRRSLDVVIEWSVEMGFAPWDAGSTLTPIVGWTVLGRRAGREGVIGRVFFMMMVGEQVEYRSSVEVNSTVLPFSLHRF